MPTGFWLGLALLSVVLVLVFFLVRLSNKMTREEEQHKAEQRQIEARRADQERANDIAKKADEAAVPRDRDKPLADRLRSSGRGRTTEK